MPKYEYLTKKDLNYKPNAFEQAKLEYLPLDKIFIDGLDKSDKKEGLLKRLKNIEDRSNNQLLAIKNINRSAMKSNNDGDDDDKINNFYKKIIKLYKNNEIEYKDIKNELNIINKIIKSDKEKLENDISLLVVKKLLT